MGRGDAEGAPELADPAAVAGAPARSRALQPRRRLVAAGRQETNHVTLWDAATGRVIGRPITVKPRGPGGAQSISFSPDSKRIAAAAAPGTVGIWEVATGRRVGTDQRSGATPWRRRSSPDGGR